MHGLGMLHYLHFGLQAVVLQITPILPAFFFTTKLELKNLVIIVDTSDAS
jgi:hypothetical protein